MAVVVHFLLVYDHGRRELLEQKEFLDPIQAMAAYAACERKHRLEPNLEIVLVGADSIETIRQTHGHYFTADEPFRIEPLAVSVPVAANRAVAH